MRKPLRHSDASEGTDISNPDKSVMILRHSERIDGGKRARGKHPHDQKRFAATGKNLLGRTFGKRQNRQEKSTLRKGPSRAEIVKPYAGYAGLIASIIMAGVGVMLGAGASYLGVKGNSAAARYSDYQTITRFELEQGQFGQSDGIGLRPGDRTGFDYIVEEQQRNHASPFRTPLQDVLREGSARQRLVQDVLQASASFTKDDTANVELSAISSDVQPKVAIIFDDIGPDKQAFDNIMAMPGPLTLSFLPYAKKIQPMVVRAKEQGHAVMLHLPMEPVGPQNPGPHALKVSSSPKQFRKDLEWNLNRFSGYGGVNNHMGSRLTADRDRMQKVLSALEKRDLFFVDSVTTANTVVPQLARNREMVILSRDVFLDPEAGAETVRIQLQQVEEIAKRSGYAIAIAHPHAETINMLGPWLTSASLRGFELVTVETLVAEEKARKNAKNKVAG